jgi:hypothetical protein
MRTMTLRVAAIGGMVALLAVLGGCAKGDTAHGSGGGLQKLPHGVSLVLPEDWERKSVPRAEMFYSQLEDDADTFRENLGVEVQSRPTAPDIDAFWTAYSADISSNPDLTTDAPRPLEMAGRPARRVVCTSAAKARTYITWAVDMGDKQYLVLTATLPNATRDRYVPVFERIVGSLKIEPSSPSGG